MSEPYIISINGQRIEAHVMGDYVSLDINGQRIDYQELVQHVERLRSQLPREDDDGDRTDARHEAAPLLSNDDFANEVWEAYQAARRVGFNDDQAFHLATMTVL